MRRLLLTLILVLSPLTPLKSWALEELPTFLPPAERIIAIGDLHGDFNAARQVFLKTGIINENDTWAAGNLVVVQTGDQLDRGDQEQELLEFLQRLQLEAKAAGGALHLLNGNHELMNVRLDLRYVTDGGFADFEDALKYDASEESLAEYEPQQRARVAAFRPGGPWAQELARRNCVLVIGKNVFVHGGVLPAHLDLGLEKLNRDIRLWIAGEGPEPENIHNSKSCTWTRIYSHETTDEACQTLADVLDRLGASRMVVGHTVQEEGIESRCDERVWCIDAGIAGYYGGRVSVLEIVGETVNVLNP